MRKGRGNLGNQIQYVKLPGPEKVSKYLSSYNLFCMELHKLSDGSGVSLNFSST